ncbi:DNA-binding protein [Oceanobacillus bengalensis]|uniref:DNA-binding protein n=1 Tax=Oceanobacillus bengalensis TaxID=1435466 RepID=A0A494YU57_9BACI|nr:DNA-binding protein [Oceanobacillus bengalensis]RKQ13656.1 DNA-binding protein [Oceanobacillus bengalensis]
MELDFFWIALGLAAFGYFIGDGLKNFNNPDAKGLLEDEDDRYELLKEGEVHWFIGVSKEDAKRLIEEYPDIPHIKLNGKNYYPKAKLREWLLKIGE